MLHSVRLRLTAWYVAILAGVLLLFSGAVYGIDQQYLLAQLDDRVHTRVQQVAHAYDWHTGHLLQGTTKQQAGEVDLLATPEGRVVQVQAPGVLTSNERSKLVMRALQAGVKGAISAPFDQNLTLVLPGGVRQNAPYRVSSVEIVSGRYSGGVLVVGLQSDVSSQLAALTRTLLLAAPLILLLCAGSGYWLAARALQPVQAITRTVRQIGETDLSRRLNLRRRDELGDLAATFDAMLDRLEAAFVRQRRFTADAGHELRTPLAAATLVAERALKGPRTPDEYRAAIGSMQRELDYMTRLANDLLTLARADRGTETLQLEEVDLGEVVLDVVDRLAPLVQQYHMSVVLGQVLELPVLGNPMYLTQLVMNVVENAVIHGAEGGDRVCIEMAEEECDGTRWARVVVQDNGPGIAPEHLPHLFDRFYRVDQARTRSETNAPDTDSLPRSGGSGLGLAIAQWIAHAHGGDIHVESQEGHGAVFQIRLPAFTVAGHTPDAPCSPSRRNPDQL